MRAGKKESRIELAEGLSRLGRSEMCDYSLHSVKSRPAKVGDKLTTRDFGTGTVGFAASEDMNIAVCVLPGTELSFADEVRCLPTGLIACSDKVIEHKIAIFRQINKERVAAHHDALEFPDGRIVLLTFLNEDQQATSLGRCERDLGTLPLLLILKREKIMVDNDKALEQRARRAVRRYWTSVLRWDPLGRLRTSCASDPRRRYEYEAVFQTQGRARNRDVGD